jgi:hypothetical protein
MASVATVVFTGIVLVQSASTGFNAYLPSAIPPRSSVNTLKDGKTKFTIQPHVAYIKVLATQDVSTRKPNLRVVEGNPGTSYNIYLIEKGETIEVKSDSTDPVLLATSSTGGVGMDGRQPYDHIVKTKTLAPKAGLNPKPTLAGTVTLKHGTAFAGPDDADSWYFDNAALTTPVALPQKILMDMTVTQNQLDLVSSVPAHSLTLRGAADRISVEIGNGTMLSILGVCAPVTTAGPLAVCDEGANDGYDFHYEVFADLLDNNYLQNGKPPVPYTLSHHHHSGGSNCPPQAFE